MRTARSNGGKIVTKWAREGFVVKEGEYGEPCYTNQFCQQVAVYFTSEQVRPGTKEEIDAVLRPIRDKQNEAARIQRAYKSGLKRIEKTVSDVIENYNEKPFQKVVFDLETTGLDPYSDEILQISAINEKGETLINTYIKPYKMKKWPEAQRVNGISPDMVVNCKTLDHYAEDIQKILLSACELIAYNGNFDMSFLRRYGIQIPDRPYFDVMEEFAPIYGEYSDYYGEYKWQKLTTCAEYYGYKFDHAHDSLEDVRATLFCYQKMRGE